MRPRPLTDEGAEALALGAVRAEAAEGLEALRRAEEILALWCLAAG